MDDFESTEHINASSTDVVYPSIREPQDSSRMYPIEECICLKAAVIHGEC